MKRASSFLLFILLLFTLSCVPAIQKDQDNSNKEGRFLMVQSPVNGDILMQVSLPNRDTCQMMLEVIERDKEMKTTSKYVSCSNISASEKLPYRATIRDKTISYIADFETITLESCKGRVEGMIKDSPSSTVEIVSPCQLK